jgi:hypothetical protein
MGGTEVWFHAFLTSALAGGEWLVSRPGSRCTRGGSVWCLSDVRIGVDTVEKGMELRFLGSTASSLFVILTEVKVSK